MNGQIRSSTVLPILFVTVLTATTALGQNTSLTDSRIYRITDKGEFQQGCLPPCLCPVWFGVGFRGTFKLTPIGSDGSFQTFAVEDVNWTTTVFDREIRITGSGTYRFNQGDSALAPTQQLELDLKVGDDPVEHFDSGLVDAGAAFPAIDITISIREMNCFDTVIRVSAEPVRRRDVVPYRLIEGSTYQKGCFDPCDCPLGPERPVVGTFALVKLRENPLFTEYAAVNVRWHILDNSVDQAQTVTGIGTYWIGGEVAVQQRLTLDLIVGQDAQTRFDSGLVARTALYPPIDLVVSVNGMICDDQVFHVRAIRCGDFDRDDDVDTDDYDAFVGCFTGPDVNTLPTGCEPADFDADADTDCLDAGLFTDAWTAGGAAPTMPVCAVAPPIPTVSTWGMIALGLLLLAGGTHVLRRGAARRPF